MCVLPSKLDPSLEIYIIHLDQDLGNFFCKGPENILGFAGHTVFVVTIQLCHYSTQKPETIPKEMGVVLFQ